MEHSRPASVCVADTTHLELNMELRGKTIAIADAAQELGREMATTMARRGARIAVIDMDPAKNQETVRLCTDAGGGAKGYEANVTDEPVAERTFAAIRKDLGGVDGLINNAGTTKDGLLVKVVNGKVQAKMSSRDFNTVVAVDLMGVFLCGREAAVHMIEAGNVGQTNYSTAKAGVAAMTVAWTKELARYKIRVAGIAPGFSETRMVESIPKKVHNRIVAGIPLRRFARPEEIARGALYIVEDDYYNGRILEIDGGLRL
ncbi:MAG: SDR family oxidoreductase [Pseudolabrys sp.]